MNRRMKVYNHKLYGILERLKKAKKQNPETQKVSLENGDIPGYFKFIEETVSNKALYEDEDVNFFLQQVEDILRKNQEAFRILTNNLQRGWDFKLESVKRKIDKKKPVTHKIDCTFEVVKLELDDDDPGL